MLVKATSRLMQIFYESGKSAKYFVGHGSFASSPRLDNALLYL